MSRTNLEKLEENTIHSFKRAKTDIIRLQTQVIELTRSQKQLLHFVDTLRAELQSAKNKLNGVAKKKKATKKPAKKVKARKPAKKATTQRKAMKIVRPKRKAKTFVASKTGKKFHQRKCPFAQNIKPKSKCVFKTRTKALNIGYKPCNCAR